MRGTYEGDGRTVFAYMGTPQIAPREKHNALRDDSTVTGGQLNEIESNLADGVFIRHADVALQLAEACRRTVALGAGNGHFVVRLQRAAAQLTRCATAAPTGRE